LWEQACADADRIIAHLVAAYHPRRVYQWGSVLHPERFTALSDIDIAVEGIGSAERWFALYGEVMRMTSFPLDLLELEHVEPAYRAHIMQHGRIVHERHN
jgi:predicted nucleotidyltransferase